MNKACTVLATFTLLAVATFSSFSARASSATWNGTTDATWAGLGNWSTTPVPGVGDVATFNNAGNGHTIIDLGGGVTVSNILFDTSSAAAYTIGLGAVGSQTLILNTNVPGGLFCLNLTPTVANNQLFNANLSLGASPGNNSFTFTNASSAALNIAGALSDGVTGTAVLTITGSGNTTISGNITDGLGSLGITKTGTGTLTMGSYTSAAGGLNVNAGTLNLTNGAISLGTGAFTLGSANNSATLSLSGGATVTTGAGFFNFGTGTSALTILNIPSGSSFINTGVNGGNLGSSTSASGILYNAGTFNVTSTLANNAGIYIGNATGSYGYIYNTGTINVFGRMFVGAGNGGVGVIDVAGGQFLVGATNQSNPNPFEFSYNSSGSATQPSASGLNITAGGQVTQGAVNNQVQIGTGTNVYTSINVVGPGSLLHLNGDSGFDVGATGTNTFDTNTCTITVFNGGEVDFAYMYKGNVTADGTFNFNGGTVMATAADGNGLFILGGTGTISGQGPPTVLMEAGGGVINLNGFNPKVNVPLLAPTANGVTGITLGGTLTGYIGNPLVKILGGGGKGAAAYTTFNPATGTITGITVTSPGTGYASAPIVTLVGGSGAIGAGSAVGTATAVATIGPVASGGLTVTGTGILTMTLNGGPNTYTGATIVEGGSTLPITPATFANPNPLVISNATVSLNSSSLSSLNLTTLTLQTNAVLNISYGALAANPNFAAINCSGGLTVPGTNAIINLSAADQTGMTAGTFTVIKYTGTPLATANFTNLVLGTLPSGLSASFVNNTANDSIDLQITFIAPNVTWYGKISSNWDIGLTENWNLGNAEYNEFGTTTIFGNPVTFDDSLYQGGPNPPNYNVNITTTVHPPVVDFASGSAYTLAGPGSIAGLGYIEVNGSGTLTLGTSNSYTGGVFVNTGTLVISNDNALGASSGLLSMNGGILEFASNTVGTRPLIFNSTADFYVLPGVTATESGAVTVPGNTQALIKDGGGTLTLGGTIPILQPLRLNAGTLNFTGAFTESIFNVVGIYVGGTTGENATLEISGGGSLTSVNQNAFMWVGGNGTPGVGVIINSNTMTLGGSGVGFGTGAAGDIGALYNNGTLTLTTGSGDTAALYLGNQDDSYGYALNTKTLTLNAAASINVGFDTATSGNGALGVFQQTAGTTKLSTAAGLAINNAARIYAGATGVGQVDVMGGTVTNVAAGTIPINNGGNLYATFNITSNALVTGPAGTGIELNTTSSANNVSTLTLHSGGILQSTFIDEPVGSLASGTLNFNGGILRASAADTTALIRSGVATYIQAAGATIDSSNFNVTVASSLLTPTGNGVTSIALSGTTTNFVGAPPVEITGGGGSGATGIALFNEVTGIISSVLVTSPGSGYTSTPTINVQGGGGDGSLTGTATLGAVSGGGLTKLGTGTLTLTGSNTYTGATVISNGEILVTQSHQAPGSVSVSDGAAFGVSLTAVGTANIGALTLGSHATNGTFLDFALGNFTNTTSPLLNCGALTLNGTNTVRIAGRITARTFPLLQYTGAILGTGLFATNIIGPQGVVAVVSNNVATSTLYAIVTSTGPGLIWTGTNSGALADVWGINTVTNWLIGSTPTTYNQVFVPGDTVSFTDSGNNLVLVNTNVSPNSVTISNQNENYTFQGTGSISGAASLTKLGTGSATLNLTNNNYSGGTVVSNGTLQLAQANALGVGSLSISPGAVVDLNGNNQTVTSLSLAGLINNTSATPSILTMGGGASTLAWTGSITNSGSGGISFVENGDNGGVVTVSGTNYFSNAATSQFNGDTLVLATTGALIFSSTAQYWIAGAVGSTATNIINGGTLVVSNDYLVVGRGTAAGTPSTARGTLVVNSGTVQKAGADNIVIGSLGATGTLIVNGGQVLNNGNLWIGEAPGAVANFYLNGGLVQANVVRPNNNGGLPATDNAYYNGGTLQASGSSTDFLQVNNIVTTNGLVLDDNGFSISVVSEPLQTDGVTAGGLTVKGAGVVYLDAGNTYTGTTLVSGGLLAGTGSVAGPVVVGPAGSIGGGDAALPGTFLLSTQPLTIQGKASMRITSTGGLFNDQITGISTLNYGGTLFITNATSDSTPLVAGETFQLFVANAHSGNFSAIASPPGNAGPGLTYTFSPATGQLTVVSTATNAPTLTSTLSGNTLSFSWPADHLGWILQTQTNTLSLGLTTNWVDIPATAALTSTNYTITKTNPTVFYRLRLP